MAQITDHVDVQAILETAVAPQQNFGIQLLLCDNNDVPIDTRYKYVTKSDFADELDSSGVPYAYSNVFFGQKRVSTNLMIGKWNSAASSPYFVWGSSYETDYLVWKAISDGSFKVTDSQPASDVITGCDFSAITSFSQVLDVLNAKLAALVAPNITGLELAAFVVDGIGRIALQMGIGVAGASSPTINIVVDATGTDIANLMDNLNGNSVAGFDAETPEEALAAISDIDDSYYNIHENGCSPAQQLALASYIEATEKLIDFVVTDVNAKNPIATTDLGYLVEALSLKRTMCIYTEKTTEYPNSADSGCVLPAEEGTTSFAYEVLALVTHSGNPNPLTTSERTALKNKKYNWIETIGDNTYLYPGITSGNEEKRIMLGRDWFVARIRESIFADQLNSPLNSFDNETLAKIEGFVKEIGEQAIERRILMNTADRPFTTDFPDADDITAATRATHTLTVYDCFQGWLNSAINDYQLIGTWTI